jgi:hypothetical protein
MLGAWWTWCLRLQDGRPPNFHPPGGGVVENTAEWHRGTEEQGGRSCTHVITDSLSAGQDFWLESRGGAMCLRIGNGSSSDGPSEFCQVPLLEDAISRKTYGNPALRARAEKRVSFRDVPTWHLAVDFVNSVRAGDHRSQLRYPKRNIRNE